MSFLVQCPSFRLYFRPTIFPPVPSEACVISLHFVTEIMRKTTRLKSGWGCGQTNSPLSTARVLIDVVGLCLLRVSEVWRLFAPDLRRWINSFSGSDFKPRIDIKLYIFVISSQTLTGSFRQSNCIHCDKNLSLYCHQNIFCSVAAKG